MPGEAPLRINQAASLLLAGQPDAAAVAAQLACELAPEDQNAWALLGLAWRLLGDPREAWLNDYRWVVAVDLEPPAGYADMAAFNAALARASASGISALVLTRIPTAPKPSATS